MREHKRVQHPVGSGDLTVQSHKDEANINNITGKYLRGPGPTQGIPIGNPFATRQPRFGVMPSVSYHDMLNAITDVQQNFRSLPARLRNRFNNNPETLLRWLENPANVKEAVKLNLIDDPEVVEAVRDAEQLDLEEQARKAAEAPKAGEAPKADPESQPNYKPPEGAKKP